MNTAYGSFLRRRAAALSVAALVAALSLSCTLFATPTPIDWSTATPSAPVDEVTAPAPTDTVAPTATQTSELPTATPSATPAPPTATSTAAPTPEPLERIAFASGATYHTLVGRLQAGETRRYVLGIAAGQHVEISATPHEGDDLTFSLIGANDGAAVHADGEPFFKGTVPSTQDYVLTLVNHGAAVDFGLSLMIPIRITFEPGEITTRLDARQDPDSMRAYVIRAEARQIMTAEARATQGEVILMVVGVDGNVLQSSQPQSARFSGNLNTTQDYLILVQSAPDTEAHYTLDVTIPPLDSSLPAPGAATRINFPAGATVHDVNGQLGSGASRTYVLRADEGQLMEVTLWPASGVTMSIVGEDGQVLAYPGPGFFRGVLPATQDYFLRVTAGTEPVTYNVTVMLPIRVTFSPGATSAEQTAELLPFTSRYYVIRALAGQTLTVETAATQGQVILIVFGADGTVLQTDHSGSDTFSGLLPTTQDYLVSVRSVGTTTARITLRFIVPPR